MKKGVQFLKDILPTIVLAITTSFMFLVYEPISLYANNINDFWFDLYDMTPLLIPKFFLYAIIIFAVLLACYLIATKLFKKITIYYVVLSIVFCLFLISYIQGNFLAGSLPGVNGEVFNRRQYKAESITSVILWVVIFGVSLLLIKKFTFKKYVSFIAPITGAVLVMLLISFASSLITTNALEDKFTSKATFDYYNQVSKNRNFFIFLVDAIDSRSFDELLKDTIPKPDPD